MGVVRSGLSFTYRVHVDLLEISMAILTQCEACSNRMMNRNQNGSSLGCFSKCELRNTVCASSVKVTHWVMTTFRSLRQKCCWRLGMENNAFRRYWRDCVSCWGGITHAGASLGFINPTAKTRALFNPRNWELERIRHAHVMCFVWVRSGGTQPDVRWLLFFSFLWSRQWESVDLLMMGSKASWEQRGKTT